MILYERLYPIQAISQGSIAVSSHTCACSIVCWLVIELCGSNHQAILLAIKCICLHRMTAANNGEEQEIEKAMNETYSESDEDDEDRSQQGTLSSRSGLAYSVGMSA